MPSEQAKRTVDRGSKNSGYNPSIARCAVVGRFQPRRRPPRRASKASLTNNCTAELCVEGEESDKEYDERFGTLVLRNTYRVARSI